MGDTIGGIAVKGGLDVRGIHLGRDLYSSGLIAADSVPTEVVERVRAAVAAAFDLQRQEPESAVEEFCQRYPDVRTEVARMGWDLLQQYAATDRGVGDMATDRWAATVAWLNGVHGFPPIRPDCVYRPELAC
jgi:hypothetical protein